MASPPPVVIAPLFPARAIGFGIPVALQVDANPPDPTASVWDFQLSMQPLADQLIFADRVPFENRQQQIVPLLQQGTLHEFGQFYPNQADQVFLHVTLTDTLTGTISAEGQIQAPWSNDQGLARLTSTAAQAGQGLTEQEHTWLENTQAAVQAILRDATGLALSTPIGALIAHPDISLFDFDPEPLLLVGRGVLHRRSDGIGVNAYGLLLSVAVRPPGFGTENGQLITFETRIGQLVAMHAFKTTNISYPTEVFELNLETFAWLWRNPFPAAILYDITPGCTVGARWLVVNIP